MEDARKMFVPKDCPACNAPSGLWMLTMLVLLIIVAVACFR